MTGRGNFFAVDRRCVEAATRHPDGVSLGPAYLVLARYASGKNHSSTRAGMTAIHGRLGLSRGRADAALKALENARLITPPSKAGTRKLVPWSEYQAGGLTERQGAVLARVKGRAAPILVASDPDYQTAYALARKGALAMPDAAPGKPKFRIPEPDYLFLPNSLVDGFRDGDEPLARLRQIADRRALQTLLLVYSLTDLPERGGLPRNMIRDAFDRFEVGRWGKFTVWAFRSLGESASWSALLAPFDRGEAERPASAQEFWDVWGALKGAGMVESVSYLCEGQGHDAQPIHAMAFRGGTEEERRVTAAAHAAALRMVSEAQVDRAIASLETPHLILCPVRSHLLDVRLVGILRPVHRADTSKTRAWAKMYLHQAGEHAEIFEQIARSPANSTGSHVASMKDQ